MTNANVTKIAVSLPLEMYRGQVIIGPKVLCMFLFEICTPEGRGGEKGGNANFKTKHTVNL